MFGQKYGFDIGTSSMKICSKNKGIIREEACVIARKCSTKKIIAIGDEAYAMFERNPTTISINRPVKIGVVADFEDVAELISLQCQRLKIANKSSDIGIVAVPYDISEVEKKAIYDVFTHAKIRLKNIKLINKPVAAAVGCGLDILKPQGRLVIDIGGGTTEISVMSLGGIVLSKLIPIGGHLLDENIKHLIKKRYNAIIGVKTAENIKISVASLITDEPKRTIQIKGVDIVTGLPKQIEVSSEDVYETIHHEMQTLVDHLKSILEKTPPEITSDLLHSELYIVGGTAKLPGLSNLIEKETNIPVCVPENSSSTVALGLQHVLSNFKDFKHILFMPTE